MLSGPLRRITVLLLLAIAILSCKEEENIDWAEYLGGPDRNHFSALDQINTENVDQLEIAWEYHTADSGQMQCNPIVVDGVLFGMTASTEPFALDAKTGKELWRKRNPKGKTWYSTSRGVAIWKKGDEKRLLYTLESDLISLNALTGEPVISFGDSGRVSLKSGLGETAKNKFVISNTPGTIYEDLIIMPLRLSEQSDAAPGYIQAFNVLTGKVAWVFKTIPYPGEEGYESWPAEIYKNTTVGGGNNWAGMAVDRQRGIIFVPTGSAAFDFYGGDRPGDNLFSNTLLALDARTGKKIWHYQLVHHDILDRDLPAPPNLITVKHNGKQIDAVAQITKHGFIFLFNRENGKPLFDIEELPVPSSDIPGEVASRTQPFPVKPAPFARQSFTREDLNATASGRDSLLEKLLASRSEGPFTPLSRKGTIIFPGLDGGAEWGGAAADKGGVLYVNSNEMPWLITLEKEQKSNENTAQSGGQLYFGKCSACHGTELKGNTGSGFPSLLKLDEKYDRSQIAKIITSGKGMMPAFKSLSEEEVNKIITFLYNGKATPASGKQEVGNDTNRDGFIWKISGYTKFLDADGNPAIKPPWGKLSAIDMNTGEYLWTKTYGESSKQTENNGSENYGGPVVTAGGLLLIAGTKDKLFHAYEAKTGKMLWQTELPAASFATPCTYAVDGTQFIVLSCGGTKLGASKGDSYVAFRLRSKK